MKPCVPSPAPHKQAVVLQTRGPSTREVEAGELGGQGHPGLHRKLESSLGYMRPSVRDKKRTWRMVYQVRTPTVRTLDASTHTTSRAWPLLPALTDTTKQRRPPGLVRGCPKGVNQAGTMRVECWSGVHKRAVHTCHPSTRPNPGW